jgi:hypothetical protein
MAARESVYPLEESAVRPAPERRDNHDQINQEFRPERYLKPPKNRAL